MNQKQCREFYRTCEEVVAALKDYQGEKIVAGEHPIHYAIVKLEKFCIERKPGSHQSHALHPPLSYIWYSLLDVSRDRGKVRKPIGRPQVIADKHLPGRKEEKAKALAAILSACISFAGKAVMGPQKLSKRNVLVE